MTPHHIPSPYLNNYTPPPPQSFPDPEDCHPNTPYQLYDLNFSGGPIPSPEALRTDKVALLPFIPSLYAGKFYGELQEGGNREVMRLMPYPRDMAASLEELLQGVEVSMRGVEDNLLFAIFDLTRLPPTPKPSSVNTDPDYSREGHDGTASPTLPLPPDHPPLECMAGIIAIFCDRKNLTGELGHIIILPKAQRTHVLSHAAGLLMHYALDFPYISTYDPALKKFVEPPTSSSSTSSTTPPSKALGLRRLQWQAHASNAASIRSAGRLGFQFEGVVRMHGTARGGDEEGRQGDGAGMSRSNWVGSITWKDWEAGGAGKVDELVAR